MTNFRKKRFKRLTRVCGAVGLMVLPLIGGGLVGKFTKDAIIDGNKLEQLTDSFRVQATSTFQSRFSALIRR